MRESGSQFALGQLRRNLSTIPRRVYTQAHMDVTAESVAGVQNRRKQARGLKMIYEPKYLRFFQARFRRR